MYFWYLLCKKRPYSLQIAKSQFSKPEAAKSSNFPTLGINGFQSFAMYFWYLLCKKKALFTTNCKITVFKTRSCKVIQFSSTTFGTIHYIKVSSEFSQQSYIKCLIHYYTSFLRLCPFLTNVPDQH